MSDYYTPPFAEGSIVQYDSSGNQDPQGQRANVAAVTHNADGSDVYDLVLRDLQTERPVFPKLIGVPQPMVYRTRPVPGPGNDL